MPRDHLSPVVSSAQSVVFLMSGIIKDVELWREALQGGRGSTIVMHKDSKACTSAVSEVGKKLK